MIGWQDEALVQVRQGGQLVDRLRFLRCGSRAGQRLQCGFIGRRVPRLASHVEPHRVHLSQDAADDLFVADAEQVGEILDRQPRGLRAVEQVEVLHLFREVQAGQAFFQRAQYRREGRDVEHHRHGAVFQVQRQGDLPLFCETIDRRLLRGRDPALVDVVGTGSRDHLRIERIEDGVQEGVDEFVVGHIGRRRDAIRVVEQHTHVADAADAGVCACRRLARFQPREAEDALLRLARVPVVVDLLVRTRGHAHAPRPALVLVHQHDAVLGTLIDGAGGACGHARRIQTVVADARQIVEDHPLDLIQ